MVDVAARRKAAKSDEEALVEAMAGFRHDPYGFTKFAWQWREAGSPFERFTGPQNWQCEILEIIGDIVRGVARDEWRLWHLLNDTPRPALGFGKGRLGVCSGKGIGKSALLSWIINWAMSTFADTKGVLTAGTEPQLRTKTWPEVTKWQTTCITAHWFNATRTSIYSRDPQHEQTWRFDAIPWNENRTEAFAGLHNLGKRIVVLFDEASQIADPIFDTTDGIFSDADTEVFWGVFGNGTRSNGRFFNTFSSLGHRWITRQIDSRTVEITDKNDIAEKIEDYGEDSDYVKVHVRGLFPSVSDMQFIGSNIVKQARNCNPFTDPSDPLIMGVDVGRFGTDPSELVFRKGFDAKTIPNVTIHQQGTMVVANRVMQEADKYKVDMIFVDETGVGAGVVDRLQEMNYKVIGVNFGAKADRNNTQRDPTLYANKRSEMAGAVRYWLGHGGAIPDEDEWEVQLTGVQYGYTGRAKTADAVMLEKKKDMKKRGLPSPNKLDALGLTFAYPVQRAAHPNLAGGMHQAHGRRPNAVKTEYGPYAED